MRRHREYIRQRTYGITPAEFDRILAEQGGRCAICRTDDPGTRAWNLDHCHESGQWRGVLCDRCNRGIGLLRDDPAIIRRAAEYLEAARGTVQLMLVGG